MATAVTSLAASRTASASAPPTVAITITARGTTFTPAFRTRGARLHRCNYAVHTVEVRLILRIEIRAAFDDCRGCALWC